MTDAQAREILQMRRENGLKAGKDPRGSYEFIEMDWGVISLDGDGVFHAIAFRSAFGTPERAAEKQAWLDSTR